MLRAKISAFLCTFVLLFSSTISPLYRARVCTSQAAGRFASARLQGTRIGARLKQPIAGQKRKMFSGQFFFEAARTGATKLLGLGTAAGAAAGAAAYDALTENTEATKRVYKALDRVIQEGGTLATLATNKNLPEDIRRNLDSPVVQNVLEYLKKMGRGATTIPASVREQMGAGFSLATAPEVTAGAKAALDTALREAKAKFERDMAEAAAKRLAQGAAEAAAKQAAQQAAAALPAAGAGVAKAVLQIPTTVVGGGGIKAFARQVQETTPKIGAVDIGLAVYAACSHNGTRAQQVGAGVEALAKGVAISYTTTALKIGGAAAAKMGCIAIPAGKIGAAAAFAAPVAAGVVATAAVGLVVKKAPAIKNFIWGDSAAETVALLEQVAAIDRACAAAEQARQEAAKKLAEMAAREAAEKAAKEVAAKGFFRRAVDTIAENKGKTVIGLLAVTGGYVAYSILMKDEAKPTPPAAKPADAPVAAGAVRYAWPAPQQVPAAPAAAQQQAPAAVHQPAVETKRAEVVRAEPQAEVKAEAQEKFIATYEKPRLTAENYKTAWKAHPLYPHDSLPRSAEIPGTTDRMALCRTGRWVDIYQLQSPATPTARPVYHGYRIPLEEYEAVEARARAEKPKVAAGAAQQQAPATAVGGGAPRDPKLNREEPPSDSDSDDEDEYEGNPKHHKNSRGDISKAPQNGPEVFKNSIPAGAGWRVGLEGGKLVVFQEHTPGKYHGYVIDSLKAFKKLNSNVMKALRKAKWINGKKFRILKK